MSNTIHTPRIVSGDDHSATSATFSIEPLHSGYGMTLGNSLRRVLLSSIAGAAITAFKIEGITHEFTTVKGVKEDVIDIMLNLKNIRFRVYSDEPQNLRITKTGKGPVKASDITVNSDVEIVNPDLVICNLDKDGKLDMILTISTNKGYLPAEANKFSDIDISTMPIDAIFSPVKKVSYKVENSRVGAETEFDRLYLTIETNGSITPDVALALSAKIMQDQLQMFINFTDVEPEKETEEEKLPFDSKLLIRVENLELSVRSQNCLKNENIIYIGDLVTKNETKMLHTPNFGKKSLNEIKELLAKMNLRFGIDVASWPPTNVEELARKYEEENHST